MFAFSQAFIANSASSAVRATGRGVYRGCSRTSLYLLRTSRFPPAANGSKTGFWSLEP